LVDLLDGTPNDGVTTCSWVGNIGTADVSISESTYSKMGGSPAPFASLRLIAYATKLTAASFLTTITSERLGNGFTIAVICAPNDWAHASKQAAEITIFIPILPADHPEITPFYRHIKAAELSALVFQTCTGSLNNHFWHPRKSYQPELKLRDLQVEFPGCVWPTSTPWQYNIWREKSP
jgi:hypothetical protein